MMDDFIQLQKKNIKRFGIKNEQGEPTGDFIEFDLNDIELPLRYQELIEKNRKNHEWLRNQIVIIDKREDIKGKKAMSKNEEDKVRALNDFFKKEIEVYNMFLGENGVQKILCGRKIGFDIFDEIDDMITKIIMPKLKISMKDISTQVKEKYSKFLENKEVLK